MTDRKGREADLYISRCGRLFMARSGLSTLAAAYPKAIIQVIIQEFMGHQLVDTE